MRKQYTFSYLEKEELMNLHIGVLTQLEDEVYDYFIRIQKVRQFKELV